LNVKENYKESCEFDTNPANIQVGSPIFQRPTQLLQVLNSQLNNPWSITSGFLVKELQKRIILQHPKANQLCHFSAPITPHQLLCMKEMNTFYLLSVIEASFFQNWRQELVTPVIFEIDLSVFNNHTTTIDGTCLIGCYNLFKYQGYRCEGYKL